MTGRNLKCLVSCRRRSGIVLLVTLVLLVVLSTLAYTVSCRVAAQRHRTQYLIDYQAARYGCDSGVKYALSTLQKISPQLISRENVPDFSDLFRLTDEQYQQLLDGWAASKAAEKPEDSNANTTTGAEGHNLLMDFLRQLQEANEIKGIDLNDFNDPNKFGVSEPNDPNEWVIPGPYGPAWPLVTQAAEFTVGPAKVKIQIEDENAKYSIGWMLMGNKDIEREAVAGFETLLEWMEVNEAAIESLEEQLGEIAKIKQFKVQFGEIRQAKPIKRAAPEPSKGARGSRPRTQPQYEISVVSAAEQVKKQSVDIAKILHSSLLDAELLARPMTFSETRKESALKYVSLWGPTKVNVNTAPRHVLESAFVFGGNADRIAEQIIQRRRKEPFKDINALKEALFSYSDSVRKSENFITTESGFFLIRVTAVSGVAKASAAIAVTKTEKGMQKIAIVSG